MKYCLIHQHNQESLHQTIRKQDQQQQIQMQAQISMISQDISNLDIPTLERYINTCQQALKNKEEEIIDVHVPGEQNITE